MSDTKYGRRQVVCSEGDVGDCMYYVRWGSVGVYKGYGTKGQTKIAEIGAGNYFGESGLLDGEARNATVVALEKDTMIRTITEDDFVEFMSENPTEVLAILGKMSHMLRNVTRDYMNLCREVAESVGEGEDEVDESSDYGFSRNALLRQVHDDDTAKAPSTLG